MGTGAFQEPAQPLRDHPLRDHPAGAGQPRGARRKAESHRRLLGAARKLFVERGYHATRPADIAREADLANGTFYLHFADKRAAFSAFSDQVGVEVQALARERLAGVEGFEARLRAKLEAVLDYSAASPGVLAAAFTDSAVISPGAPPATSLRLRLGELMARALCQAMQRGEIRGDYDPELIARGIVGLIEHAIAYWSASGRLDREALIANVTNFCTRALVCPAASEKEVP